MRIYIYTLPNQRDLVSQPCLSRLVLIALIFMLICTPAGEPEHGDQADQHKRENHQVDPEKTLRESALELLEKISGYKAMDIGREQNIRERDILRQARGISAELNEDRRETLGYLG